MINVLVVDDDYHVAHAHALTVATVEGFTVIGEAHSGGEALALIASTAPDLLLLDMYLPDFSGLEVMRQAARVDGPLPAFVLVTAARDIEAVRSAMQLGAFYYLVKPFSPAALREQLQAYAAWVERLTRAPRADQKDVDDLFSMRGAQTKVTSTPRELEPTVAKVLEIVAGAATPMSATDVAQALGASRPTAQRCLAKLVRAQLLDLDLAYGATGRPQHRYLLRRR